MKINDDLPSWTLNTLQGLAYWIKWRKCYFARYPLGEAAITAEACGLIYSKLAPNESLCCEVLYKNLGKGAISDTTRADLVIARKSDGERSVDPKEDISDKANCVFEFKRWVDNSSRQNVLDDIKKLHRLRGANSNPELRLFSVVVSQGCRPKPFVNREGTARRRLRDADLVDAIDYKVKAAKKATESFRPRAIESASYAVLLELL